MAKAPRKVVIPQSYGIEEYWDIPFTCIGRQEWFDSLFTDEARRLAKKIVVQNPERDLLPFLLDLEKEPILGVDSETTGIDKRLGLDPWREGSEMLLLQIGTPRHVYLIEPALVPYFEPILTSTKILHILHNAVYDWKWLYAKHRIHMNRLFCTMLGEQLLTAGLYGLNVGLADVCRRYAPYRLISKKQRQAFVTFAEQGGRFTWEMLYYAARDIPLLFPVMQEQTQAIKNYKMEKVAGLEFRLIPCMAMMELGGVYINQRKHRYAIDYWERRLAVLEGQILSVYNEEMTSRSNIDEVLFGGQQYSFRIQSTAQKLEAMRTIGFEIEDAQRETLEGIDHRMANLLVDYSEAFKIVSTYGESMLARVNPTTGKLHPRWNQLGAGEMNEAGGKQTKGTIATGRVAGDLMQLPKDHTIFEPVTDSDELARVRLQFAKELYDVQTQPGVSHDQDLARILS